MICQIRKEMFGINRMHRRKKLRIIWAGSSVWKDGFLGDSLDYTYI